MEENQNNNQKNSISFNWLLVLVIVLLIAVIVGGVLYVKTLKEAIKTTTGGMLDKQQSIFDTALNQIADTQNRFESVKNEVVNNTEEVISGNVSSGSTSFDKYVTKALLLNGQNHNIKLGVNYEKIPGKEYINEREEYYSEYFGDYFKCNYEIIIDGQLVYEKKDFESTKVPLQNEDIIEYKASQKSYVIVRISLGNPANISTKYYIVIDAESKNVIGEFNHVENTGYFMKKDQSMIPLTQTISSNNITIYEDMKTVEGKYVLLEKHYTIDDGKLTYEIEKIYTEYEMAGAAR